MECAISIKGACVKFMPKCKNVKCKKPTSNRFGLTYLCDIECVLEWQRQRQARKERREIKIAKQKLKTRQDWLKDAQAVFNRFIRLRDVADPCISCGRQHSGQYHAGHYRTTKAAPQLRFNEDNVHKQCRPCNEHLSGNLIAYRVRLIEKIGSQRVMAIENDNEVRRFSIEDLKALKKLYQEKVREIEKRLELAA